MLEELLIVISVSVVSNVTPLPALIPLVLNSEVVDRDDIRDSPFSDAETKVWELLMVMSVSSATRVIPVPDFIPFV